MRRLDEEWLPRKTSEWCPAWKKKKKKKEKILKFLDLGNNIWSDGERNKQRGIDRQGRMEEKF